MGVDSSNLSKHGPIDQQRNVDKSSKFKVSSSNPQRSRGESYSAFSATHPTRFLSGNSNMYEYSLGKAEVEGSGQLCEPLRQPQWLVSQARGFIKESIDFQDDIRQIHIASSCYNMSRIARVIGKQG